MSLISSLLERDTAELPHGYICDEEFIREVRSSLESFAEENSYGLEENVQDDSVHWALSRTDIDYGPMGKVYGRILETELEFGEVYDSINFEDNSYKIHYNRKRPAKAPRSDKKGLREEIESNFSLESPRSVSRTPHLHQPR